MPIRGPALVMSCGASLALAALAQQDSGDQNWNRRPPGAGNYRIVLEVSGRSETARFFDTPSPMADLRRICDARQEAAAAAIPATERHVAGLRAEPRPDPAAIVRTLESLGQLWSHDGRVDRAIAAVEAAYGLAAQEPPPAAGLEAARPYLEAVLGVLHLRRGELENCIHDRNAARCIFPIRSSGQHQDKTGSAAAVEFFLRHLRHDPGNLEVRWLLNVAYMTLGRYPHDVPAEHVIPAAALVSAEDPGLFADLAWAMGLDAPGLAGGVVVDDMDGDGRLDVVLSSVDACAPLRYYRNKGDGTFEDCAQAAGLFGQLGGINLVQTDYNNDGRPDLFVMRGGWEFPMRNSLLRGNADGTFTDVTAAAGLSRTVHRTHSAAWADYDNDGWLDLYVGHEESPAALFRNRRDGTFEDVARMAGVDRTAFTKGATWGDYDGDGDPDLYVSNYGSENFLFRNQGDGTFREVARQLGVHKPLMSFPTWFWDYDNDGRLDLFVASFVPSVTEVARHYLGLPAQAESMKLYRNTGVGFADVTREVGLERVVPTMGANFGDVDNDGFLEMYLGTGAPSYAALMPNVMFRNRRGRAFVDVTSSSGTGHLQKGHGVAFADFDDDGDEDVFANIGGFVPGDAYHKVLFRNPGHGNDWIGLRLEGVKSNRPAIGAKISVRLVDSEGRERLVYREVTSGGSFGASSLAQHIGLGRGSRLRAVELEWPGSRTRQVFTDLHANRWWKIRELDGPPRPAPARATTSGRCSSGRCSR